MNKLHIFWVKEALKGEKEEEKMETMRVGKLSLEK